MNETVHLALITLSSLLPITNPLGNAAIFLSLTKTNSACERHLLAARACLYMFIILCVCLFAGNAVIHFFGLSLEGIRIAGGLLIMKYGFDQLEPRREKTHSDEEHAEARKKVDISFSPLAMPLLAGPGAIAAVMSSSSLVKSPSVFSYLSICMGLIITCLICWMVLRGSETLMKFLGVNGANALTKIMGFILLCMGVQLTIDGIKALM